ncbi:hypothetical protein [Leptolyngbya sp. CCY15150]|uniref:hypothetical protein n=1 Tax=Leptolyngbya sp. CCY15150 TaxID=2767772 RepID=UPI00194FC29B|nr:hypothetical protein [Leptolyngbya sp. CCY15150]
MRVILSDRLLLIHKDDVPQFKKGGSTVRNTFFWALRSIAGTAPRDRDWEFEAEVWIALSRLLISFSESGYLPLSETMLEFDDEVDIPDILRGASIRR